eukprot:TRINITY_DN46845_c0_g1_i1.p2 TRINITY_DN46845_c0_g1~~TRINITY_DN46845_c0_g1_i1.p2  ORF type:complete len:188 (+),score=81.28 TRINITY_DN46845_c0_g1_i1:69-566(+)
MSNPEEEEVGSEMGVEGLLWVQKPLLEEICKLVQENKDVPKEKVNALIEAEEVTDDAVMVPVDMSEAAELEDVENVVENLGPNKVAKLFAEGRKKYEEALKDMPEDVRGNMKQEITGKEYKEMMEEEREAFRQAMLEAGECAESEEALEEDEEDAEPQSKKQKTA